MQLATQNVGAPRKEAAVASGPSSGRNAQEGQRSGDAIAIPHCNNNCAAHKMQGEAAAWLLGAPRQIPPGLA